MAISARIPDPFVVCVHRRGDVRYCALSQYIAKCRELIQAGKFDDIEGLAYAHEFGQQAREAIGAARKLLPWKQPAATEAAANLQPHSVYRNTTDQNLPVTGTNTNAIKALDSITCLVVEGPEVMPSADIVRRIKAIVDAYATESHGGERE